MPDNITTQSCDLKCAPKINYSASSSSTTTSMISKKMQYANLIRNTHRYKYNVSNNTPFCNISNVKSNCN